MTSSATAASKRCLLFLALLLLSGFPCRDRRRVVVFTAFADQVVQVIASCSKIDRPPREIAVLVECCLVPFVDDDRADVVVLGISRKASMPWSPTSNLAEYPLKPAC